MDESKRDIEADAAFIDALYAGDEKGEWATRTDDEQQELSSLASVRGLFRDMPDYEPSSPDAILMAAAREASPSKEGVLARWLQWFQHPAAAAVASLVVVVGIAGTLYVTGAVRTAKAPEPADTAPREALMSADGESPASDALSGVGSVQEEQPAPPVEAGAAPMAEAPAMPETSNDEAPARQPRKAAPKKAPARPRQPAQARNKADARAMGGAPRPARRRASPVGKMQVQERGPAPGAPYGMGDTVIDGGSMGEAELAVAAPSAKEEEADGAEDRIFAATLRQLEAGKCSMAVKFANQARRANPKRYRRELARRADLIKCRKRPARAPAEKIGN